ncbi:MAG: DUF3822 family protein [Flammeovirgaceae bacterium]|nr:DUF3822 family protein [Flammeovirgaceae bacterium]
MDLEPTLLQPVIGSKLDPEASHSYLLLKRIKDDVFNTEDMHNYELSLMIGLNDFQFCIVNQNQRVVLFESYLFESVKTVNSRVHALMEIFKNNHVLMAGFWKTIRVAFKTHKYTLVPNNLYEETSNLDYLEVNSRINTTIETTHHYEHSELKLVNIYVGDFRILQWLKSIYKLKKLIILHQGSALIEGIRKIQQDVDKELFISVDRGVFHVLIFANSNLHYYNQFSMKSNDDFLRYIMLVFQELSLDQRQTKTIFWGNFTENSDLILLIKKYVRHVALGKRPKELKFGYQFDELFDHEHFDLFNIYSC